MNEESAGKFGCFFMVTGLIMTFLVNPFAYGGAIYKIYGIDNMTYGQKWVGGLSGFAVPIYLLVEPIDSSGPLIKPPQPQNQ
jgi:hypothetical protein